MINKAERKKVIELYVSGGINNIEVADYLLKGFDLDLEEQREFETIRGLAKSHSFTPEQAVKIHRSGPSGLKVKELTKKKIIHIYGHKGLEGTKLIVSGKSKKIAFYCGRSKPSVTIDVSNLKL